MNIFERAGSWIQSNILKPIGSYFEGTLIKPIREKGFKGFLEGVGNIAGDIGNVAGSIGDVAGAIAKTGIPVLSQIGSAVQGGANVAKGIAQQVGQGVKTVSSVF